MGKPEVKTPAVYECIEPFSPAVGPNGVPEVYGHGQQVLEGHPILDRFANHFELVTDKVLRRERNTPPSIQATEQETPNAQV